MIPIHKNKRLTDTSNLEEAAVCVVLAHACYVSDFLWRHSQLQTIQPTNWLAFKMSTFTHSSTTVVYMSHLVNPLKFPPFELLDIWIESTKKWYHFEIEVVEPLNNQYLSIT